MRLAAITLAAIMAAGSVIAADRVINQSVDTATARVEPKGLYLFRGESVVYTVTPTRSGSEIRVTTNATARWYATTTTNVTLTVIDVTGSVATNGVATFTLSTNQTAMAAGTYDSFVQLSDTGSVLCASRATLTVFKSTFAQAVVPATNAYYLARTDPDGTTCVYTNGKLRVLSAGGTLNHASLTNLNGDVAAQHISTGRVALIDGALQPAATNGLASTGYVWQAIAVATNGLGGVSANDVTNSLNLAIAPSLTATVAKAASALQGETDTLASVAARGGFAGSEDISPDRVSTYKVGTLAGDGANAADYMAIGNRAGQYAEGVSWDAYGRSAGQYATGSSWNAYGHQAGYRAKGSSWDAYGILAGQCATGSSWAAYGLGAGGYSLGNQWGAYGRFAGVNAVWTNSCALGQYAGHYARGVNRLYVDLYPTPPSYPEDGATNDAIFGDNGFLYLGRGGGAPGGSVGGQLRGTWDIGAPTGNGASLTGITAEQVGAVATNTIIRGGGYWLMSESGGTSILYHVTSTAHTNLIGTFYSE